MQTGPKKGSKFCDLIETIKFLYAFRKQPQNVYQLYHSKLRFYSKKIYRYLRYCLKTELLEIDHIQETKFLPSKYYRLTQKGKDFLALFKDQTPNPLATKQQLA